MATTSDWDWEHEAEAVQLASMAKANRKEAAWLTSFGSDWRAAYLAEVAEEQEKEALRILLKLAEVRRRRPDDDD